MIAKIWKQPRDDDGSYKEDEIRKGNKIHDRL